MTNNTFWPIVQWTSRTRNYQTPHLNQGEDLPPAVSHSDKCIALHKHLLPAPPPIENPPSIDLTEHPNDIEWHKVSSGEVHRALWKAASHNAPGPSGLCGLAYKIGWKAAEAEITAIVQAAIEIGYHPQQFHNSIVITIRKPNKPDYTHSRAYCPIQLLEVIRKVIEQIVSNRLSFYASQYELLPVSQFSGTKGRSTDDATLSVAHDIKAPMNHNLLATSLPFDIT